MKRIEIHHLTGYEFGAAVRLAPHALRLRPREGHDLRIASSVLRIEPEAVVTWRRDLYDNVLGVAAFAEAPATALTIESRVEVELYDTMPLDFLVEEHALHYPFEYRAAERMGLEPYLQPVYPVDARLLRWLAPYRHAPPGTETFALLDRMNGQIHRDFAYEVREEEGVMSPSETARRRLGSCRDLATLLMESCRRLGIAARFVSGYVHGPATEAGGAATHAWAEVYLPGGGWKGFDPTTAAVVGPDHIPVAVHREPQAVPPVAGRFVGPKGLSPLMRVGVQINQLQSV